MQEFLYETADAGDILSDRRCRSLSIRHRMQDSLLQTAYAGVSVSDSGCRRYSFRQRMQDTLKYTELTCILYLELGSIHLGSGTGLYMGWLTDIRCKNQTGDAGLYQTGDEGLSLSDSRCRTLSNRQQVQESFY